MERNKIYIKPSHVRVRLCQVYQYDLYDHPTGKTIHQYTVITDQSSAHRVNLDTQHYTSRYRHSLKEKAHRDRDSQVESLNTIDPRSKELESWSETQHKVPTHTQDIYFHIGVIIFTVEPNDVRNRRVTN
jgi:hypothetical protein